jgi:hypothetical protein
MQLFLNRYTTLPIALDILANSHITLLSPDAWEDRNDAYYLERYRQKRRLSTVLAVCFSACRETFHHWKVFSSGNAGVCLEFDRSKLLEAFPDDQGFVHGMVEYRLIKNLKEKRATVNTWPFLKRKPFSDEREFRILYESSVENIRSKPVKIDLTSIQKVTLSPWLNESVAKSVVKIIKQLRGCERMDIRPSSLLDNARWRKALGAENGTAGLV